MDSMKSLDRLRRKPITNPVRDISDFTSGDNIYCHFGQHKGEYAQIQAVGNRRLTVNFPNLYHKGNYVDYNDATILDADGNPILKHAMPPRYWMEPSCRRKQNEPASNDMFSSDNEDMSAEESTSTDETDQQLSDLLQQLAITTGIAIQQSAQSPDSRRKQLSLFYDAVQKSIDSLM